jgi:class 3 adenylate cyclase
MIACIACSTDNPDGMRFCGRCGQPLQARERRRERKVVSVVFVDLVGFTRRSEQLDIEDVQDTLASFHQYVRHVLESFGGTVEKFIGDAVMAVFGAPVAHEDDPERAVRAALSVRTATGDRDADLHVRIGVNTGEVLVSIGADPNIGEGIVAGDVVNTAARLQAVAPVDQVLVGAATERATRRTIAYRAHEPVLVKGKADAVECWLAVDVRSRVPTPVRSRLPLVGRDADRRLLVQLLDRCRADRCVQLVTLLGPPGIGKSRLVEALGEHLDAEGALTRWRRGHVLPYGQGVTYWPLAEIVKQECDILESDDALSARSKLDAALGALPLAAEDRVWVDAHVGPLVGQSVDQARDAGGGRNEAFAGWQLFVEAMAADTPTVLVVEDVHWAEDALLDFLDELVDRVDDVPLLVIVTARPELLERRPAWGGGKTNATCSRLSPLTGEQMAELVGTFLEPSMLPASTVEELIARSEGNPLYAHEFVRVVVERGANAIAVPDSVQGIIAARLDGLTELERSVVVDASVLGRVTWRGAIAAVGERDLGAIGAAVESLERKQLVRRARRSTIAGEMELALSHALVADVAYERLTRPERQIRHERAASWLERHGGDRPDRAELVAHHLLAAIRLAQQLGTPATELAARAVPVLVEAVRNAADHHDDHTVVRLVTAAQDLGPRAAEALELAILGAVGACRTNTARDADLHAAVDAAVAAGRLDDAVAVVVAAVQWARQFGDPALQDAWLETGSALASELPPGPMTTQLVATRLLHDAYSSPSEDLVTAIDAALRRVPARDATSRGLLVIVRAITHGMLGRLETAIADFREGLECVGALAGPIVDSASFNVTSSLIAAGRLGEAREALAAAVARARRVNARAVLMSASVLDVHLTYLAGGEVDGPRALAAALTSEHRHNVGTALIGLAQYLVASDPPAARRAIDDAIAVVEVLGQADAVLAARSMAALVYDLADDPGVDGHLDVFIDLWRRSHATFPESLLLAGFALARRGRHVELSAAAALFKERPPYVGVIESLAERRYAEAATQLDALGAIAYARLARSLLAG